MPKKLTITEFIDRAKIKHNHVYDYSSVVYINSHTKIKIICPKHGEFEQKTYNHLNGDRCPNCYGTHKYCTTGFIEKAKLIHGDKFTYENVDYINNKTKVTINCTKHGEFEQTPNKHLRGSGCPVCRINKKSNTTEFIKKANIKHDYLYDYTKTKYVNSNKKVMIICVKHGEFEQTPNSHLNGGGCPKCTTSKGENKVMDILNSMNIKYITQKTFKGCVYKKLLRFDFYLPEYNTCIEYDGLQHFQPHYKDYDGTIFKETLIKDEIKNIFCEKNGIHLIRIKYDMDIKKVLNNITIYQPQLY